MRATSSSEATAIEPTSLCPSDAGAHVKICGRRKAQSRSLDCARDDKRGRLEGNSEGREQRRKEKARGRKRRRKEKGGGREIPQEERQGTHNPHLRSGTSNPIHHCPLPTTNRSRPPTAPATTAPNRPRPPRPPTAPLTTALPLFVIPSAVEGSALRLSPATNLHMSSSIGHAEEPLH